MGVYSEYVLPRLLDLAMRNSEMARLRADWISRAAGRVLEIGIGSGLNLPFYSREVDGVLGIDPSPGLQRIAQNRAAHAGFPVELITQSAELPLPIADSSLDTVVVTWTLCSVGDPTPVLRNAARVLKPDGQLIFLEHGRAPEQRVAAWQDTITPYWKHVAGGCTLNRPMDQMIRLSGFHIQELSTGYMRGPRPLAFMYKGIANPVP